MTVSRQSDDTDDPDRGGRGAESREPLSCSGWGRGGLKARKVVGRCGCGVGETTLLSFLALPPDGGICPMAEDRKRSPGSRPEACVSCGGDEIHSPPESRIRRCARTANLIGLSPLAWGLGDMMPENMMLDSPLSRTSQPSCILASRLRVRRPHGTARP